MIVVIAVTEAGRRTATHLATALPGAQLAEGSAREAIGAAWEGADALILCMATGAAVRLVAPLLADKHDDPPVVSVDETGSWVVALTGGHHGGNDLARRVAQALGATPVVTTATEAAGMPALDHLGAAFGLRLDPATRPALAGVTGRMLAGENISLHRSAGWAIGPLPDNVVAADTPVAPGIAVTDKVGDLPPGVVVYRPPSLVVGVGASRGAPAEEISTLIDGALAEAGVSQLSVSALATVTAKADEEGILDVAAARGWPVVLCEPEELAAIEVPNPSSVVQAAVGTPSVAEAAALSFGGDLLVAKRKSAMATVAVARRPVRGRLALVSTGPGAEELVPPLARQVLGEAEVVVGLDQYVGRIRQWLRPGCEVLASPIGDEVARAEQAVAAARSGRSVALISGGDVGVYAMGSPALERAGDDIDVVVVPGVTAAVAAAALLGSPLGHDHCAISLSDLLTPYEVIRRRVKAAAEGDFVVSFYNPRSRGRNWQLDDARLLLLEHRKPDTPVGIVTDAYRPTQRVVLTTLGELDTSVVDMLTIVVVGNSQTRMQAGRMVTPRGYA